MAQITDEQILSMIKMNARDFWTIAEENTPRFIEFEGGSALRLSSDNFVSVCITQFIELKRGKNFGAVKIHSKDDKKEDKPNPDKPVIQDPDVPLTTAQKGKLFWMKGNIDGATGIIQAYLDSNKKKKITELTKGQASELIDQIPEPGGNQQ